MRQLEGTLRGRTESTVFGRAMLEPRRSFVALHNSTQLAKLLAFEESRTHCVEFLPAVSPAPSGSPAAVGRTLQSRLQPA